jgi:hypothetical protein
MAWTLYVGMKPDRRPYPRRLATGARLLGLSFRCSALKRRRFVFRADGR